jgi:hypothetical protein
MKKGYSIISITLICMFFLVLFIEYFKIFNSNVGILKSIEREIKLEYAIKGGIEKGKFIINTKELNTTKVYKYIFKLNGLPIIIKITKINEIEYQIESCVLNKVSIIKYIK